VNEAFHAIDNAIHEIKKLRSNLKKKTTRQVSSIEECALIKATALSWFNTHQKKIYSLISQDILKPIDQMYQTLLQSCDRATSRKSYDTILKDLSKNLIDFKTKIIHASSKKNAHTTTDIAPDFAVLTTDTQIKKILNSRWEECYRCIAGKAPLAATVMMGGFLETLLLSRINKEPDQSKIFKANTAPKDKTGKSLGLKDWTLRNYIDVAHELKWISQSAKDIGEVLRDYRNYIHPYKQFSHGTEFTSDDASLFWEITKSISRQLLV